MGQIPTIPRQFKIKEEEEKEGSKYYSVVDIPIFQYESRTGQTYT
jgi:hypothetical protein